MMRATRRRRVLPGRAARRHVAVGQRVQQQRPGRMIGGLQRHVVQHAHLTRPAAARGAASRARPARRAAPAAAPRARRAPPARTRCGDVQQAQAGEARVARRDGCRPAVERDQQQAVAGKAQLQRRDRARRLACARSKPARQMASFSGTMGEQTGCATASCRRASRSAVPGRCAPPRPPSPPARPGGNGAGGAPSPPQALPGRAAHHALTSPPPLRQALPVRMRLDRPDSEPHKSRCGTRTRYPGHARRARANSSARSCDARGAGARRVAQHHHGQTHEQREKPGRIARAYPRAAAPAHVALALHG
jgi:hypothetical protein